LEPQPAQGHADPWFRPVWEDGDDDPPPLPRRPSARPAAQGSAPNGFVGADLPALLGPLTTAQDALARLDARAEAAPEPVRGGLIARLAFREAAGWLATLGCWVHPRDLALRAAHLIGATELPNTAGHHWQDMDSTTRLLAEGHVATALALARLLRHLVREPRLLADADTALAVLAPLTGAADPSRFAAWQARWSGKSPISVLLTAALAAADWMEAGVTDCPSPLAALAAGAGLLALSGSLRTIPLPFWAAAPALAAGDPDGLPRLRSDAAARAFPAGPPAWPGVFLTLVTEAARFGLQELNRLQRAAAVGAVLTAPIDQRGRLSDAVEVVLREPAVTAKSLARHLRITPQAALRLLTALARAGVVRETTGRRSFRAFAV
jgi:HTH DNA binding domain